MSDEIIEIHPFDIYDLLSRSGDDIQYSWDQKSDVIKINGQTYRENTRVPYKGHTQEFLALLAKHKK